MPGARYVVLGLAPARAPWFREVALWSTTGSIAAEFVKCLSAEEVRARLGGGRPFSALLVDAALGSLDRDLIDAARDVGCAVIVVEGHRTGRDWTAIGADAVLGGIFDRKELLDTLAGHARSISRVDRAFAIGPAGEATGWRSPLAVVTGPGGTGASTVALALAQGLADDVRYQGAVLLADLRLHAELAMLHDAHDVVPGIQEVVDAFRTTDLSVNQLRSLTFDVPARGYRLLLGLRRSRAWGTIRPRAFEAALEGLRRAHLAVVADVDPELEGEEEGGSIDVEERHTMSRTACAEADVAFVVGAAGMKGLHAQRRVIVELLTFGVPAERIVPVVNRAPRHPRTRAEITGALAQLLPAQAAELMGTPLFLPDRRVDETLRDARRIPEQLVNPLLGAWTALSGRGGGTAHGRRLVSVNPGSVGRWAAGVPEDEV